MVNTSVNVVVLHDDSKHVLLNRNEGQDHWELPGGSLQAHEMPEVAALRETRAETGYDIMVTRLVGEYPPPQIPNTHEKIYLYLGKALRNKPAKNEPATTQTSWFPLNSLPRELSPDDRQRIIDAVKAAGQRKTHVASVGESKRERLLAQLSDLRDRFTSKF